MNNKQIIHAIKLSKKDALDYLEDEQKAEVMLIDDTVKEDDTGQNVYDAIMGWDLSMGTGEDAIFEAGYIAACNYALRLLGENV